VVYGLKWEEEVEAVEIFVGEFDCRDQNNQRKEIPTMDKDKQERRIGLHRTCSNKPFLLHVYLMGKLTE